MTAVSEPSGPDSRELTAPSGNPSALVYLAERVFLKTPEAIRRAEPGRAVPALLDVPTLAAEAAALAQG